MLAGLFLVCFRSRVLRSRVIARRIVGLVFSSGAFLTSRSIRQMGDGHFNNLIEIKKGEWEYGY